MSNVQFIEQNGQRQYAVVPIALYQTLLEKAEWAEDVQAYEQAKNDDDEYVPDELVGRILAGENKVKVWREYRALSQTELSVRCGLAQATIAQLEGGKRKGSVAAMKKIANALMIDLDDLV